MASLSLRSQPAFSDVADDPIDLVAIDHNAQFAIVREEEFWGFYRHGETVGLPISQADGYQYSRDELLYSWAVWWTGGAPNECNGTHAAPKKGATSGAGTLLQTGYSVDQSTGLVSCQASYYKAGGIQMDAIDGILLVVTHALRLRMSLTLQAVPGFSEVADAVFDTGNAASDSDLKALNGDVKFSAVRNEQFWGFYKDGEAVALPQSPADGYQYAREELRYTYSVYWSGAATGSLNGTHETPTRGATGGAGVLLQSGYGVDQDTGVVSCQASYYKAGAAQTDTNDGILLVITHAQRMRSIEE